MTKTEQVENCAGEWGNSGEASQEDSDYQTEERLRAQRYLDGHKEWWDIYWTSGRY
jgi:hypothetical protein